MSVSWRSFEVHMLGYPGPPPPLPCRLTCGYHGSYLHGPAIPPPPQGGPLQGLGRGNATTPGSLDPTAGPWRNEPPQQGPTSPIQQAEAPPSAPKPWVTTGRRSAAPGRVSKVSYPPPPLAHARPCLSTGWALNRRSEEILGPLCLWSRMEDWVFVERLYRERGAH